MPLPRGSCGGRGETGLEAAGTGRAQGRSPEERGEPGAPVAAGGSAPLPAALALRTRPAAPRTRAVDQRKPARTGKNNDP